MYLRYWWVSKLGDEQYAQHSLVVCADSIADCHKKFEQRTGVDGKHCYIEDVEEIKSEYCHDHSTVYTC